MWSFSLSRYARKRSRNEATVRMIVPVLTYKIQLSYVSKLMYLWDWVRAPPWALWGLIGPYYSLL